MSNVMWDDYGDHGWGMGAGMGWGGWLVMSLLLLMVLALAVGAVVVLLRSSGTGPGSTGSEGRAPTAEMTLDERYARGEIDEDEYRRRKSVLRSG